MSYRCVKEMPIGAETIPVGMVIEHVGHDDYKCVALVTFAIGDYHYAVYADAFHEHFEEVES